MKRTYPTPGSLTHTAKMAIAALPALTILLAAVIALATQPSPATARKPLAASDRYPEVIWPARGAGDFVWEPPALSLTVTWPALGAGDFLSDRARLP